MPGQGNTPTLGAPRRTAPTWSLRPRMPGLPPCVKTRGPAPPPAHLFLSLGSCPHRALTPPPRGQLASVTLTGRWGTSLVGSVAPPTADPRARALGPSGPAGGFFGPDPRIGARRSRASTCLTGTGLRRETEEIGSRACRTVPHPHGSSFEVPRPQLRFPLRFRLHESCNKEPSMSVQLQNMLFKFTMPNIKPNRS